MAFVSKYYFQYDDYFGNTWRYDLLFNGYSGASSALMASGNPLNIDAEGSSQDPFTSLKPKSATIEIIASYFQEYIDIFTAEQGDVQMKIVKEGNLEFHGIVLPQEYSEEYHNGNHVVRVVACDGLSILKHIPFVPMYETPSFVLTAKGPLEDQRFSGFLSEMAIIRSCLDKIEFGLDYKILDGSDFYEYGMSESTSALRQAFHNRAEYRSDDGYMDCYSVLEDVLFSRCVRLVQAYHATHGLCWFIEPIVQLKEAYTAWVIATTGGITGIVSISNFVTVTGASGSPLNAFTDLSGLVEVENIPGKIRVASNLTDNNIVKDAYDYIVSGIAYGTPAINYEDQSIEIKSVLNPVRLQGVCFNLGWAAMTEAGSITIGFIGNCFLNVILTLTTDDDHVYVYDKSGDDWILYGTTEYYLYQYAGRADTEKQYTTITTVANATKEGRLTLIIKPIVYQSTTPFPNPHNGNLTFYLNDLNVKFRDPDKIITGARFVEKINSNNYTVKTVDIPYSDPAPRQVLHTIGMPNYSYANTIMVDSGQRIEFAYNWHIKGRDEYYYYLNLILQMYDEIYSRNRWRLSGNIIGQMNLNSILLVGTRIMLVDKWSLNTKTGIQSVTLLEIAYDENILITESTVEIEIVTESDSFNIEIE
jgi:hypothetical protein